LTISIYLGNGEDLHPIITPSPQSSVVLHTIGKCKGRVLILGEI